jgi:hypothetical protein
MWDLEAECPNAPLTDQMVAEVESSLNVRLPASYVDALRQKNGGSTIGEYIRLPAQDIPQHLKGFVDHGYVSIGGLNGIGTSHQSITQTPYLTNEWQLPNGLVLLDGDGHTWIAFDYRKPTGTPPIVFVVSDSGDTLVIANSFAELFASLIPHEELFDEDGEFIDSE